MSVEFPTQSGVRRHFLLLQGPCGNFFRRLQTSLEAQGHACTRVVINGGDLVNTGLGRKVLYRRSLEDWPAWLMAFSQRQGITDVVAYGDCRSYHRRAIATLKLLGVAIHVLEEGYLRPYWITCERDGVNGHSKLVDLDVGRFDAGKLGPPEPEIAFAGTQHRYMWAGFLYYLWTALLTPLFPRYVSHRDLDVGGEAALWLARFVTWPGRRIKTARALEEISLLRKPVHLALLQLNGDSQTREHSSFSSVRHFVEHCMAEFAASGVRDAVLVFKNHPLDNGVVNLARLIRDETARHGLGGRVFFVETAKLVALLNRATSVIVINSTACHQALQRGIPTLVMGRAIYNHPEIVPRMRLANFFRARPVMRRRHYKLLVSLLAQTSQMNGGYYGREAQALALPALTRQLIEGYPEIESFLKPAQRDRLPRTAS